MTRVGSQQVLSSNLSHLLGIPWRQLILLKSKKYKENWLTCDTINFLITMAQKCDKIMARLNLSVLRSCRWSLDFLFLIKVSFNKISCFSILNTVGLRVPSKINRGHCSFCTKANPLPDLLQRLQLSVLKSIFSTYMAFLWSKYFYPILIDSLIIAHLLSFPWLIPSFVPYFFPS
jgi:hypothetical protein